MYEYISGRLDEIAPTEAIIEAGGIGYKVLVSLTTFSALQNSKGENVRIFLHHQVREDDESLYGFSSKDERTVFTHLISVSGVGTGSARMILSSMNSDEVRTAILSNDVNKFKSVKGIGLKTAQRIILELKDKIGKGGEEFTFDSTPASSPVRDEALSALCLLGFPKPAVEKVLASLLKENSSYTLEELIKKALKAL
ncbi:MAG: Holliday junction branch migration protein RuvA [Bacteroidales bacterium]|nr:Holliday junction branch migration protein RuvA [Candidatus Cacconaster merdequi]